MPLTTDIDTEDLVRIERMIRSALIAVVPSGNFKEGTFLNDIVVRAMAVVPAIIEKESVALRNRQSLVEISALSPDEASLELDALVSNWFVTRKEGTFATTTATVHFSAEMDEILEIPAGTEFTFSAGNQFTVNTSDTLVLNRDEQLTAVHAADGSVAEYILYVPLITVAAGTTGTLYPGRFQRVDNFSPYFLYAELETALTESTFAETNADLIERARSSLSERGLTSAKSIRAVLREEFVDVVDVTVVGAGAAEMQRDLITNAAFGISVHVLGHVNVYCLLPIVQSARLALGTLAADAAVISFPTTALTNTPFVRIRSVIVGSTSLDRCSTHEFVEGDVTKYSTYNSRTKAYSTALVNSLPVDGYSVSVANSAAYGSMEQVVTLTVGNTVGERTYTIEYDGVRGLYPAHILLKDRERRVVSANALAYSFTPVVLSASISVYKKSTAPSAFPLAEAKAALCRYVNDTLHPRGLRVSDLVLFLLNSYPLYLQGVALPLTISYVLQSPSGREIAYSTQDRVTVENMGALVNSTAYSTSARLLEQVSDSTVRFVTFEDLVTITELS